LIETDKFSSQNLADGVHAFAMVDRRKENYKNIYANKQYSAQYLKKKARKSTGGYSG